MSPVPTARSRPLSVTSAGALAPRSRAATNDLLAQMRADGWCAGAWLRLLIAASRRSVDQARRRPRALAEVTALHLAFAAVAGRRGSKWIVLTWSLAATHLGLLEDRRSLGTANVLTLVRANLPAIESSVGRWVPVLALTSDFIDGKLARGIGAETSFGQYADFLADTAFWTWFSLQYETSRTVRTATFAAWLVPVIGVLSGSIARGRMIEVPRRWWFRPAAVVQVLLGLRVARRWNQWDRQTPHPVRFWL